MADLYRSTSKRLRSAADALDRLRGTYQSSAEKVEEFARATRNATAQRERLLEIVQLTERRKFSSPVAPYVSASKAQFYQDIFCLLLNGGKRDGFFVEFGACDGVLISNSWLFEKQFGWTGILAEPSRYWHDKLEENRSCFIDRRCVWSESGKTLQFAEFENDIYQTEASLTTAQVGRREARKYDVLTVSLADLLDQYRAPSSIDFMSIDVEGSELELLRTFPFDRYSFDFLAVEHHTADVEKAIRSFLEGVGYRQILRHLSGYDGFYIPKDHHTDLPPGPRTPPVAAPVVQKPPNTWLTWFEGKKFTTDWASRAFSNWQRLFENLREQPLRILEVGAWEGRSTIFFLRFLPRSEITCVDLFSLGNEELFDCNTAEFGERIEKLSGRSAALLDAMAPRQFDLIYIDGSHERDDVMIDSLLAWRLLIPGGHLIWDDYEIGEVMNLPLHATPKPAVDTFLSWYSSEVELIDRGYQVVIRKRAPSN